MRKYGYPLQCDHSGLYVIRKYSSFAEIEQVTTVQISPKYNAANTKSLGRILKSFQLHPTVTKSFRNVHRNITLPSPSTE
jgi:hypothetical protein